MFRVYSLWFKYSNTQLKLIAGLAHYAPFGTVPLQVHFRQGCIQHLVACRCFCCHDPKFLKISDMQIAQHLHRVCYYIGTQMVDERTLLTCDACTQGAVIVTSNYLALRLLSSALLDAAHPNPWYGALAPRFPTRHKWPLRVTLVAFRSMRDELALRIPRVAIRVSTRDIWTDTPESSELTRPCSNTPNHCQCE